MPPIVAHPSLGTIDNSLEFIVTTMRLHESYIDQMPDWVKELASPLRYGKPPTQRIIDRLLKGDTLLKRFENMNERDMPSFFLGDRRKPLERVGAPRLADHLAELGFIPQARKMRLRTKVSNGRIFDLNIYWGRRSTTADTDEIASFTLETSRFFQDWLRQFGWSVQGMEFVSDVRVINLFFHNRRKILPSERHYELIIAHDEEAKTTRLVAL